MDLFLVRHGETDWLAEGRLQGNSQVSINIRGKEQALTAAQYFKKIVPDRVLTSALTRAKETAGYIGHGCNVSVETDERLNEICFGEWEGRRVNEIESQYPEGYRDWLSLKEHFQAPGGESIQSVRSRVLSFFEETRQWRGQKVVAVSHGGPIRLLLLSLLAMPLSSFRALRVDPGSVTVIQHHAEGVRIAGILNGNRTA